MRDRLTVDVARKLLKDHPELRLSRGTYYRHKGSRLYCCALALRVIQKTTPEKAGKIMFSFVEQCTRWQSGIPDFREAVADAIGDELGYLAGLDNGFEGICLHSRDEWRGYKQGLEDGRAIATLATD